MKVRSISINTGSSRYYWFLLGTLVFYLFVACESSGFHHPDEHFQIIEFANYKLGTIKASDLAWEFNAHIRPGLQPMICYWLFKLCRLLGIMDVYQLALVLRMVTAVFSVWVIHRFILFTTPLVNRKYRTVYILLSFMLWFLPYVNVRFSSETWSGLLFMIGLSMLIDKQEISYTSKSLVPARLHF